MIVIQFLGEWLVRSSVLILAGALLVWLLRPTNPEFRLTAWTAMLVGSMAIPLLAAALPKVPMPLLRAPAPQLGCLLGNGDIDFIENRADEHPGFLSIRADGQIDRKRNCEPLSIDGRYQTIEPGRRPHRGCRSPARVLFDD
jgi:hypothetical protein